MTKITKSFALLCVAAPLAVIGAETGTNSPVVKPVVAAESLFTNTLVAKGTGISVSRNQLDDEVIRAKAGLAAQNRTISPEEMPLLEEQVLDQLVMQQLVMTKVTDADRAKGKEDFEQKIKNAKTSDEQFEQHLTQQLRLLNVTREQWEKQTAEQIIIPLILTRELNINFTEEAVKKFYDENPAKFEVPEMVRVAHILLATSDPATHADLSDEVKAQKKKQMEDILKRAKAGEDFGKLADQFSEDPGVKENHGEYKFSRDDAFVPEFKDTAFSLTNNQISGIFTSQFGFHIMKAYEKIPAKKLTFTDKVPGGEITVAEWVKNVLTQQDFRKKTPDYIAKLRKDAGVEILDEKLKAATAAREKLMEGLKDADVAAPGAPKSPDKAK